MGARGEDMQQRTTGRNRTRVAAIKTAPLMVRTLPGEAPGRPTCTLLWSLEEDGAGGDAKALLKGDS